MDHFLRTWAEGFVVFHIKFIYCVFSSRLTGPFTIFLSLARSTQSPGETVSGVSEENTVILAVVGAILCTLLLVVIIILTYLLCKWWNRKTYVAKRIMYA